MNLIISQYNWNFTREEAIALKKIIKKLNIKEIKDISGEVGVKICAEIVNIFPDEL